MTDKSNGVQLYQNLLSTLANAPRGDIELDVMIAYYLGNIEFSYRRAAKLLVDKGFAWELIANLWEGDPPRHTRSLDAALPGEHITAVACAASNGRWVAIHTCDEGLEHVARASSEVLARRLAALKWLTPARVAARGKNLAVASVEVPPTRRERSQKSTARTDGPLPVMAAPTIMREQRRLPAGQSRDAEDWKIRF